MNKLYSSITETWNRVWHDLGSLFMHVWCHDILSLYIRHHTQDRITLIVISSPSPFFLFLSCLPLLLYDRVCDSILLLDSSVFDAIFLASLRLHLCSQKSLSPSLVVILKKKVLNWKLVAPICVCAFCINWLISP